MACCVVVLELGSPAPPTPSAPPAPTAPRRSAFSTAASSTGASAPVAPFASTPPSTPPSPRPAARPAEPGPAPRPASRPVPGPASVPASGAASPTMKRQVTTCLCVLSRVAAAHTAAASPLSGATCVQRTRNLSEPTSRLCVGRGGWAGVWGGAATTAAPSTSTTTAGEQAAAQARPRQAAGLDRPHGLDLADQLLRKPHGDDQHRCLLRLGVELRVDRPPGGRWGPVSTHAGGRRSTEGGASGGGNAQAHGQRADIGGGVGAMHGQ